MIGVVALAIFAAPPLAPPIPWAAGFAPEGSLAFVADMDGDGYADLVRVVPNGDSFIDVSMNIDGFKAGRPARALSNWGKDCQAAAVGNLESPKRASVVGIFDGLSFRLAHCDAGGKFEDLPDWAKLPTKLEHPHLAFSGDRMFAWDEGSGKGYSVDGKKSETPIKLPGGCYKRTTLGCEQAGFSAVCLPIQRRISEGWISFRPRSKSYWQSSQGP